MAQTLAQGEYRCKEVVIFMKAALSHVTLTVKLLCQFIFMSHLEETYTYLQFKDMKEKVIC